MSRPRVALSACLTVVLFGARAAASTTSEPLVWPGSIAALESQLTSDEVEVRRKGLADLSRLPPPIQRRLLPTLFSDPDPEVRLAVADAALAIRLPDAGARVVKWLSDSDARVREAAAEVLSVLRYPGAISGLGRALEDSEAAVRAAAALALGSSRSPDASSFLLGHLDDNDPEVRHAVIAALEELRDPRAVVPLIGRIQEQRATLRRQAAAALGTLGDARATSALIVALADGDAGVRAAAARSLGKLRAEDAVWSLGALLETEADPSVQDAVIEALGAIGSPSSVDAILRVLGQARPGTTRRIERALSAAGEVALPGLERCVFQPPRPDVAGVCVAALGMIGGEAAHTVLELALRQGSADPVVALKALGEAQQPSALPTVLEYLTSAAPAERRAALDAAGRLMAPERELGLAVEPLVLALERARGSRLERAALLGLLGRTGSPRAAAALIPEARGDDEYLRCVALEALGQLGPSSADQLLIDALDSPHFPTRWTAAIALRRVGSSASLEPILKRLDEAASSRRETLAVALAGPLGAQPSEAQLARVLELLNTSSGPTKDALIEALARAPGARGTALLGARLSLFGKATRAKLAEALGHQPEARDALLTLLKDTDAAVRANAVWSMGSAGTAADIAALSALLDDREISVAANSVAAVALIASRSRIDVAAHLCRAMDDPRSYVRANALAGLRLTASSCPDAERAVWLLEHDPSDEVRLAAARLIRDQAAWSSQQSPLALARCAAKDRSGQVAAECARAAEETSGTGAPVEVAVLVVPAGSTAPASSAPFSLVRADGLIRSGSSDRRGWVWEPRAPRGTLRLTIPSVFVD